MRITSLLCLTIASMLTAITGCGEGNAIVTNVRRCGPGTVLNADGTACVRDAATGGSGGTTTVVTTTGGLACGEGLFEFQGECVDYDPTDSLPPNTTATPLGGKFFTLPTVELSGDEPATIFYTTDGSDPSTAASSEPDKAIVVPEDGVALRYFAVDAAGNQELTKAQTYVVDDQGPAPVTDLTVIPNGTALEVTWTNPADTDFEAAVVLRQTREPAILARIPDPGTTLSVGDVFDGLDVVFVGTVASFMDDDVVLGQSYSYVVLAHDDIHNFSEASTPAQNGIRPGAQAGQISIADPDGTPVVTITTQPNDLVLAATASFNAGSLTLDLDVTNNTGVTLHSPKAVVTSANLGDLTETGTVGADPYVRIGTGFGLGASESQSLVFTGVDASADPMVIDLTIAHDETLLIGGTHKDTGVAVRLFDTATGTLTASVACVGPSFSGNDGSRCSLRDPVMSLDGQFLYGGSNSTAHVKQIDLTTGALVQALQLDTGPGSVRGVTMSHDGATLYALHSRRCPGGDRGTGGVDLVEIDRATLVESDRLALHPTSTLWSGESIALSPDGETLVVTTANYQGDHGNVFDQALHLVDVATFALIDTDNVQGGVQSFDPLLLKPRLAEFHGNDVLYFSQRQVGMAATAKVDVSQLRAGNPAAVDVVSAASIRPDRIKSGPDGRVWELSDGELRAHDDGVFDEFAIDGGGGGYGGSIVFSVDGNRVWSVGPASLVELETTTLNEIGSFGHAGQPRMHWMLRSPF